jgi:hypothetical protein
VPLGVTLVVNFFGARARLKRDTIEQTEAGFTASAEMRKLCPTDSLAAGYLLDPLGLPRFAGGGIGLSSLI